MIAPTAELMDTYTALAEIAGVFVGFGALISTSRSENISKLRFAYVQAVIALGLVSIVGALIPLIVDAFRVPTEYFWVVSSGAFICIIGFAFLIAFQSAIYRESQPLSIKNHPLLVLFFWTLLETPIQIGLIANVFSFMPEYAGAFYMTAVVFNLFEATFFLGIFVFTHDMKQQSTK